MNSEPILINRVNQSGLVTIKLEDFFPTHDIKEFDLKDYLFQGLILKEMDFRKALKEHHWDQYQNCYLTVFCSTDAIIPTWAYMLVASQAESFALDVAYGNKDEYLRNFYRQKIKSIDPKEYMDAKIVIKGCSEKEVPASAYLEITRLLKPYASSIMFGEPCSTVPVYKKAKV
ncbi:MAG: DUF2480 family protein [Saprospiraceae bacterium]|nr:DUF2480 family protein [Saprospiraceae bacterium]MBK9722338.1 DUF2480 family protein [Saprospiraceae bacterium]